MAILAANIKWYQCTTWIEGDTHGGDIDVANEITSGADQNIFDDVSDAERVAGDIDYRKIYIKNLNVDTWNAVKDWFSAVPANTTVAMALGTTSDVEAEVKTGGSAPLTYVTPTTKVHADVLTIGNLVQNAYKAIWIKRTVTAGAAGETADNFTVKCESS